MLLLYQRSTSQSPARHRPITGNIFRCVFSHAHRPPDRFPPIYLDLSRVSPSDIPRANTHPSSTNQLSRSAFFFSPICCQTYEPRRWPPHLSIPIPAMIIPSRHPFVLAKAPTGFPGVPTSDHHASAVLTDLRCPNF
ncbi:hypothetical protein Salat_2751300 [Sesamum alatum]|uniref:Uncharacterized protein n=1 Tax=Sesamum alatum TaxID=300844 RepID=A0AAE2C8Y1_9LAMI|nr:hypothetical protein Salat_2751300 [Sesamum alatum]